MKRLLADAELDKAMLKEPAEGNFLRVSSRQAKVCGVVVYDDSVAELGSMLLDLRPCDPVDDRAAAHEVLRAALVRDDVGYTLHPGEWDWWSFHRDPRTSPPVLLIGDRILIDFEPTSGELSVFGATPSELVDIVRHFGEAVHACAWVLDSDYERAAALATVGFGAPTGDPGPLFTRSTHEPLGTPQLPDGLVLRPVAGLDEAPLRSAAARRSFRSDIEPDMDVARYRSFMQSPAYVRERDLVVFDEEAGRVAAFAMHWVDTKVSLSQLEPVGTDPDYVRKGLARALVAATLGLLHHDGIRTLRVTTDRDNPAAIALYRACGFEDTDTMRWWGPLIKAGHPPQG